MKKQLTAALVAGLFISSNAFALSADDALSDTRADLIKDTWGDCILTHDGLNTCKAPVESSITLGADAFFDFDKDTLKPAGRASLDNLAAKLGQVKNVQSINLSGNTDSVGSESYNQDLSARRAQAVANYIIAKGVPASIVTTQAFGESRPVASNATPEGRAQNRRVDIKIVASETVSN